MNIDNIKYFFLFGRLFGFILFVAVVILVGVLVIKGARKRRERNAEAIHQLFNPDEPREGEVSINIDPLSEDTNNNFDNNNNY